MKEKEVFDWKVEGMTCNSCATHLKKYLASQGLEEIFVNFATDEVQFTGKGIESKKIEQLNKGIQALGFQVVGDQSTLDIKPVWWTLKRKVIVATAFTFPLLITHFLMLAGIHWPLLENPGVQFLLCLPVYIIGFFHFGKSAFFTLRNGNLHMDVLIFMGSTAAFVYSLIGLWISEPQYIFFETAATIITFVLIGNWIERRAVKVTTTAIDELSALQAEFANRIDFFTGKVEKIAVDELKVGDQIQINEGDNIPTDSVILQGALTVDESMLSGESAPISKSTGDTITGATTALKGNCRARVAAVGSATVLAQIVELVKKAQAEKTPLQRLADYISSIFIPTVIVLALIAIGLGYWVLDYSLSRSIMNGVAVLVISCPCAMGLATPTAVMVGVGRMARNGILVKGGKTVEAFSQVKHFVFDKTGTLTESVPLDVEIEYFNPAQSEAIKHLIYQMECHSSHPIALSLRDSLGQEVSQSSFTELLEISEEKGRGLRALDDEGNTYFLGRQVVEMGKSKLEPGLYLTKNKEAIARIHIPEVLKAKALTTVNYIKAQGGVPHLLSGDSKAKTDDIAQKLGIEHRYSEQSPTEKLHRIESLTKSARTAMIGDGINDAPALAKATVGVSLSDSSKVAMQSAQIVLLNGQIGNLAKAISISKQTVKTIRENLFWAFAYNLVAIPIAMLGGLNPMFAALFMAFSDVVVIGNSVRLNYKKIDG